MQFYARCLMIKKIIICLLLFTTMACKEKIEEPVIKLGTSTDYTPFEYKKDENLTVDQYLLFFYSTLSSIISIS